MSPNHCKSNRWQGFILGLAGSVAGLLAMGLYWRYIAPLLTNEENEKNSKSQSKPLDDISLIGKNYKKGESSTAALGRLIYRQITGAAPKSAEAKTILSNLVHWGYGLLQGGLYGLWRSSASGLDPQGGLLYGTVLWLLGDELAVPLLGLQSGPTAAPPMQHLNRLGAHWAYGLGTAVVTQMLRRLL